MKKTILLLSTLLILTSCGQEVSTDPLVTDPKLYFQVPFSENTSIKVKEDIPLSEPLFPLNTTVYVQVYKTDKKSEFINLQNKLLEKLFYYHAILDNNYHYEKDGKILNNLTVVNESYGTGNFIEVDKILYDTLSGAIDFQIASKSAFNLTIGALTTIWNQQIIDSKSNENLDEATLKNVQNKELADNVNYYIDPSEELIDKALLCVGNENNIKNIVELKEDGNKYFVRLNKLNGCEDKVRLTLGAAGKGKAIDLLEEDLKDNSYLLNAGSSSIKLNGEKPKKEPCISSEINVCNWTISTTNPLYKEKLDTMDLALNKTELIYSLPSLPSVNYNLSTSGFYEQYYYNLNGELRTHIISNNGYSSNYHMSVSLLSKSSFLSDMFTTAIVNIKETSEIDSLVNKYENVSYILMDKANEGKIKIIGNQMDGSLDSYTIILTKKQINDLKIGKGYEVISSR